MLKAFTSSLIDFLFPKTEEVYKLETLTAGDLVRLLPPAGDLGADTVAVFNYAEPRARQLIWELKYRKNSLLAQKLASILMDVLRAELSERALYDNFVNPLLIPMPMSKERYAERGWNQTEFLCEELVKLDTEKLLEYLPHVLLKDRHTESQARTKNKKERLGNVENSMKIINTAPIEGRNIILLDDVTTTGATFREACKVLKEAGARKVFCLAIAH